jgi:hypothetical protein
MTEHHCLKYPDHKPNCALNLGGDWCDCKPTHQVIREAEEATKQAKVEGRLPP